MPHCATNRFLLGDARLETFLCQGSQQGRKVVASAPSVQSVDGTSQGRLIHHRQRVIGVVGQVHAFQRVLLRQLLFAERRAFGQGDGLPDTEGRRIGMMIRSLIHRHAETLSQRRLFQGNGKRDEWLIALNRRPVGLCMEKRSPFLGIGQRTVRQGETHSYLHAPSAGSHECHQGLRKQSRLRLDMFRLCPSRQLVHFKDDDAIVALELPGAVRTTSELRHGIHTGNPVDMRITPLGALHGRQSLAQPGNVSPLRLVLHLLQKRFQGTGTAYFRCIFLSNHCYLHTLSAINVLQIYNI